MKDAKLREHPGEIPDPATMLGNLLTNHESIIRGLRADQETVAEKCRDMGTNDFLIGLMEKHEKMAWMLRAFQEGTA